MSKKRWIFIAIVVGVAVVIVNAARAQTIVDLGTGFGYSTFIDEDTDTDGSGVTSFISIQVPIDEGKFYGEYDDEGYEIFYPDWYAEIGYTISDPSDPVQGVYLMADRRLGASDLFGGLGLQAEIWDESIRGKRVLAVGGRVLFEFPSPAGDLPARLFGSLVVGDSTQRIEFGIMGTR